MGLTVGVKGYRLWCLDSKKIILSRDVTFDESIMLKQEKQKDSQVEKMNIGASQQVELEITSVDPVSVTEMDNDSSVTDEEGEEEVLTQEPSQQQDSIAVRRPRREIRKPARFVDMVAYALPIVNDDVPSSYKEAIRSSEFSTTSLESTSPESTSPSSFGPGFINLLPSSSPFPSPTFGVEARTPPGSGLPATTPPAPAPARSPFKPTLEKSPFKTPFTLPILTSALSAIGEMLKRAAKARASPVTVPRQARSAAPTQPAVTALQTPLSTKPTDHPIVVEKQRFMVPIVATSADLP
ncbi:hypothetical protein LWI29_024013 [Acer saccharum]|uniref:Retroviral polymerase SH3-like domain-containing protein n=1 Tax=Acer saccharum TaxID=4024 RepID=A0AA39RR17_ACESA|nr:hypothetical protein LWI29_024013 [Acer saccharum]